MLLGMLLEAIETDLFFDPEDNKLKKYNDDWFDMCIVGMDEHFHDKFDNSIYASHLRGDKELYIQLVFLIESILSELGLDVDTLPNNYDALCGLLNELLNIKARREKLLTQASGNLKRGKKKPNKMVFAKLLFIALLLANIPSLGGLIHTFAFQEYRLRQGRNFNVWNDLQGQRTRPEIAPKNDENSDPESPKL